MLGERDEGETIQGNEAARLFKMGPTLELGPIAEAIPRSLNDLL
jgi:hypothetical protein